MRVSTHTPISPSDLNTNQAKQNLHARAFQIHAHPIRASASDSGVPHQTELPTPNQISCARPKPPPATANPSITSAIVSPAFT
eukprot:2116749-Pyramimonas_sp.AAC.1